MQDETFEDVAPDFSRVESIRIFPTVRLMATPRETGDLASGQAMDTDGTV
jgi:hypothetical protein